MEGAVATALLFTVGKALLGLYLGKAAVGSAYGAAGSLIAVIVWVYYSAMIFYLAPNSPEYRRKRRAGTPAATAYTLARRARRIAPLKHAKLWFGKGFRVVFGNRRSQMAEMVLEPGDSEGNVGNRHKRSDQWLYVVGGTGTAIVNGRRIPLASGVLLLIEHQDRHEIKNTGRSHLRTLNWYSPPAYTKSGNELPAARRR